MPLPKGLDVDALLAGYRIALRLEPLDAIKRVVLKLVTGTWHEPVTFCPRPPELARMVRDEDRRQRLLTGPKPANDAAAFVPAYARALKRWDGATPIGEDLMTFNPKDWPAGSIWVPILGKVFAGGHQ